MKCIVDSFVDLGRVIEAGVPRSVVALAVTQNEWFSEEEINLSLRAICKQMLQRDRLESWLSGYDFRGTNSCSVLIVMAGNIPLVALFDLLCVLAAGHHAYVKFSHKDYVLMEWVVEQLRDINPSIPIYIYNEGDDIDRVIATGGDVAARHFDTTFSGLKRLIRGSRHSVAVLGDGVTDGELSLLSDDIYRYSGLGCRNVSMLFVPRGFNFERLKKAERSNIKYVNNYLQTRALLSMNGAKFYDNGVTCMRYSDSFPAQLSELSICEYEDLELVERWLASHDEQIQCVVTNIITHTRGCGFGEAQSPTLYDYADGVDTMNFLR
ncbi:MAG: aldehyde dehydrogenase [Rikenellaceae bacterium]